MCTEDLKRPLAFSKSSVTVSHSYDCLVPSIFITVAACYVGSVMSNSLPSYELQLARLLSVEFSRQGYWSGLSCPSLADLPNREIEPISLPSPTFAGRFFTTSTTINLGQFCLWGNIPPLTDDL